MRRDEKRIPTIVALFLLTLSIGGIVFGIEYGGKVLSRADPDITPKEVRITNVADTSVSVSWLTAVATTGRIAYGEGKTLRVQDDDRKQAGEAESWQTHYFSIRNLKPLTTYTFKVISGGKEFDDGGEPFTFTTGSSIPLLPPSVEPAYGRVINEDNQSADGAIVYLTLGESAELSSLVKPSGEWLIAINNARTRDGRAYLAVRPGDPEVITVKAGIDKEARAITDTEHDGPVPTIIIGKSYDFRLMRDEERQLAKVLEDENVLASQPAVEPTQLPPSRSSVEKISILVPEENGTLATTKPLFRGSGIPGKVVLITVESTPQKGEVVISGDGTWYWSPPENLEPGEHTVTIRTTDERGKEVIKKHTFTIFKSGTQVLGEATPSATLTPTATPSLTATPTIRVTATPTLSLTLTPSPTTTDSGIGGPPQAGNMAPTLAFLGVGALMFFFGLLRFFAPLSCLNS